VNDLIRSTCAAYVDSKLRGRTLSSSPAWIQHSALLTEGYDFMVPINAAWVEEKYETRVDPQFRWDVLTVLGLHPVEAFDKGVPVRIAVSGDYNETNPDLAHPLNVGLMFARHLNDKVSADLCIAEYPTIIEDLKHREDTKRVSRYKKKNFGNENNQHLHIGSRFWTPSWYSPDPAESGISFRIEKPHAAFDNVGMVSWFSDQAMQAALEVGGQVEKMADVAAYLGRNAKHHLEGSAARKLATAWSRNGRIAYDDIAIYMRLARRDEVERRLRDAKGVRSVLGIVRRDTPRDLMISGLSQLAQMDVKDLSGLYGRAPTVSELVAVRSHGLVKILFCMPYVLLKEVLEEEGAEQMLRARLISELGKDTEILRNALADHGGRVELKPYPLLDPPIPQKVSSSNNTTTFDWDLVFGKMAERFRLAVAFRMTLRELVDDPVVRVACAAKLFDNNPHVTKALEQLPNWDRVEDLLKRMPVPSTSPDVWVGVR
jgi:hypothetical protein